MVKSRKIFEEIRELKNQGKSGKEISKKTGISKNMVYLISSAIKHNCGSISEYKNYIIKKIINPETGKNFSNKKEYNNYIARKNGFRNENNYIQFRKFERENNSEYLSKQEKFERSIKLRPIDILDKLTSEEIDYRLRIEHKDNLELLLDKIPERYRIVLEARYLDGRSMEETANLLFISHQAIQQIEKRAFEYFLSGKKIKNRKTIEYGEILLVYILSKSIENNNSKLKEILDLTNEIYYGNKKIKNKSNVLKILYNKDYKKRTEKIKKKYFPL